MLGSDDLHRTWLPMGKHFGRDSLRVHACAVTLETMIVKWVQQLCSHIVHRDGSCGGAEDD